ncbi:hypothetical protein GOM49_12820 [Clostridium bovifaecis]|uniref:PilZ domain-containing protein n=1 Tax=Clostridium bovifaecis TaxID=2184719 RepID=A0A6I6EQ66_9CLOT|nr:hypothetical protein GOM49_12820 [Clostridium bovifaecis]
MIDSFIRMNTKLEIIDSREENYLAKIEVVKESCILIKILIGEREIPKIVQGHNIKLFIYDKGKVYSGTSILLGIRGEGNIARAVLAVPENIKKVERRKYFRLPVNIEIEFVEIPMEKDYEQVKDIPREFFYLLKSTNTIDMSGGGMKIISEDNLKVGQKVLTVLYIPIELKILCSVVRSESEPQKERYKVSLKFENISERNRDKIIEFIFNQMRENVIR